MSAAASSPAKILETDLWARRHQKIQPTHAWAYALEAAHAKDGPERIRTAAMTLHLGPASERLKALGATTLVKAREHLKRDNPFQAELVAPARSASNVH